MLSFKNIQRVTFLFFSLLSFAFMCSTSQAGEPIVSRATFSTAIVKHEPVDEIKTIDSTQTKIYFFTEIKNYKGRTITHQWSVGNWVVQSIPLSIKSSRWRTSSSKSFSSGSSPKGTWVLRVLDEKGNVLKESYVNYIRASSTVKKPAKNSVKKSRKSDKSRAKKSKPSSTSKKKKVSKKNSAEKDKTKKKESEQKKLSSTKTEKTKSELSNDESHSKKLSDDMDSISKRIKKAEENIAELVDSVNDLKAKQGEQASSEKETSSPQVKQSKEDTAELVSFVDEIKAEAATTNTDKKTPKPSSDSEGEDEDDCTDDE